MIRPAVRLASLVLALALPLSAYAAEPPTQQKQKSQAQQQIYGSQLMTPEERTEYRNKMRSLKTTAERDKLRAEHHAAMQARAKERGVTLPETPPAKGGRGAGRGQGGPGYGAGGGSGAGPGAANR
jgi:hypothetical protein